MIYLITGTPGTGKTSLAMKWVLDNKFDLFKDEFGNFRPLFSVNIPEIDKKIIPVFDVSPEDFISKPLHENFEQGSVIFVDEASEIYPARSAASKLPAHVEGLNKLRHYGLTLILLTQSSTMIDSFVRNLVSKHVHIDRKQIGSKLYEWNFVQTSFNETAFKQAYSEIYKPDKRTFNLYKSSNRHIKFKKSLSWYWYAIPILPLIIFILYYFAYSSVNSLVPTEENSASSEIVNSSDSEFNSASSVIPNDLKPVEVFSDEEYEKMSKEITMVNLHPTLDLFPESAPIYRPHVEVKQIPHLVGCVSSKNSCNCYTQQATIVEMDFKKCMDFVKNRVFNPFRENSEEIQNQTIKVDESFKG